MLQFLAAFCFIISFLGLGVLIWRKIPILLTLEKPPEKQKNFLKFLKEKILLFNPFKNFSLEIFLQKILVKIRILTLKVDYKIFNLLKKLRDSSQKKKELKVDNYWDKIKKEIKKTTKKARRAR